MLKLGLWIGAPSLLAIAAMAYTRVLENFGLIFLLSVAALVIAIVPQLSGKNPRR